MSPMEQIVTVKINNEDKSYPLGIMLSDVLKSIDVDWQENIIAVKVNNEWKDIKTYVLENDIVLEIITKDLDDALKVLNYSAAIVLAKTLQTNWKNLLIANINVGDEDFFVDFDFQKHIKEQDLEIITKQMQEFLKKDLEIKYESKSPRDLQRLYENNPYFLEQLLTLKNIVGIYTIDNSSFINNFIALNNTKIVENFMLLSVAGVYWNNDTNNKQIQRIYGVCHFSQEKLAKLLELIALRKERDHRKIGKDLEIFMFDSLAGQGLPIWLPNGMVLKKQLQEYLRSQEFFYDYLEVATPVMGAIELYCTSGHWDHYQQNMFPVMSLNNEQLVLRPMSCPHHCLIYCYKLRSYRDLPLRFAEHELLYRYEASGALTGLERVRTMELTDAHIFCRFDQIKTEFQTTFKLITEILLALNIEVDYYSLSLRDFQDKKSYYDNDEMWIKAEKVLKEALDELKIKYIIMLGEAAFYGPKLDIQIKTVLGHDITVSTIQLDFLLPEKFNLSYQDENAQKVRPIIIHRGLIGTYERFIAVLLEQTGGVLPLWLSPKQIALIPIKEEYQVYCYELEKLFKTHNLRSFVDAGSERLGYKIRIAQTKKIPFQIVIGQKEIDTKKITYRQYGKEEQITVMIDEFINLCNELIVNKK
ncbi:threonine--tRNA ligase [Spiroplasma endosymbiont of Agriotes lineatus]|uniref:threonine--tRNA ligase n=1 Tax=Spiroplasma endosymbiont of Agriotes lineatus TaxID=3077930 RepID=UPI0030D284A4